ncbi:MAG: RnfABCDGE type electron transport complex subunit B, partial [Pseudomonadota bacterium]|nr:RnfABCDGE type electron transport complex subunit B [Pseudomonadota bacterium]
NHAARAARLRSSRHRADEGGDAELVAEERGACPGHLQFIGGDEGGAAVGRQPLDAEHGVEKEPVVAWIREAECIGCTKCIQACPVDAILGAAKVMHTVIADECTGCDLCIEPCPVDCIDLVPRKSGIGFWHWPLPEDRAPRFDVIATDAPAQDAA